MPQPVTWQTIQNEALRRIRDREWKPGQMIPHEADLAEELGCARATVNRALRELAAAGFLERRRKAGTRVALNPVRKATFDIPIIRHDVEGRGAKHGYRLLDRAMRTTPAEILREAAAAAEGAPAAHRRAAPGRRRAVLPRGPLGQPRRRARAGNGGPCRRQRQ